MKGKLLKKLNYLSKTIDAKLRFKRKVKPNFEIFPDASFFRSGESTIGLVHMFNVSCFDWVCYKDDRTSNSTNESEFTSIYQSSNAAVYYADILWDFGLQIKKPIFVTNDNTGAVRCAMHGIKFDSRDFGVIELRAIERCREVDERENWPAC